MQFSFRPHSFIFRFPHCLKLFFLKNLFPRARSFELRKLMCSTSSKFTYSWHNTIQSVTLFEKLLENQDLIVRIPKKIFFTPEEDHVEKVECSRPPNNRDDHYGFDQLPFSKWSDCIRDLISVIVDCRPIGLNVTRHIVLDSAVSPFPRKWSRSHF